MELKEVRIKKLKEESNQGREDTSEINKPKA